MEYVLNGADIKALEASADANGVSYLRLMENAGAACAKAIRKRFDAAQNKRVSVFCGKGKNGGDGFVIARKLYENGYDVRVFLLLGDPTAENAIEMRARATHMEIPISEYDVHSPLQKRFILTSGILVDALFGTGFSGDECEALSALRAVLEEAEGTVFSVDVPSGLLTDSGAVAAEPVKADVTLTVMALKPSLTLYPAKRYAGEIEVVRIGVPEELYAPYDTVCTLEDEDICAMFPKAEEDANKGDFGKLLILAGSYAMPGAAVLSSAAAVECGAGLVRLAFPDKAYAAVTARTPEKVLLPLESNREGRISFQNEKHILDALKSADACLLGCGMGVDYDTKAVVESVLRHAEIPVILDADGINAVASDIDIIKEAKAPVILTPHPGEAARLLGCTPQEVQANRLEACRAIHEKTGAVVVLKGAGTLLTADGAHFLLNLTGDEGLATAGSGDVLAGVLAAFLVRGLTPIEASAVATYLHGKAGEAVSKAFSKSGNTPSKVLDVLPKLLASFE